MATTTDPAPEAGPTSGLGPAQTPRTAPASPLADRIKVPSRFPYRTIAMGTIGSTLLMLGALGAGGILIRDPILGSGPLSWVRYGHGRVLANLVLYAGFALEVWAWVRLGRYALARRVGSKPIVVAAACWMAPLLISPPLFTRDVFSYLGQGAQLLHGLDPYKNGPIELNILPDIVQNVHPLWQTTPAPYGPLFLLVSKGVVAISGDNAILGVILMRVVLCVGLGGILWSLPRLVKHLGGNLPITMWLAIASPMTVIHLFGGPHNELLMLGFLAPGVLSALERKHALSILLVTIAALIKPSVVLALPFLVWIWANHLPEEEGRVRNFVRALLPSVAIFAFVFLAGTWVSMGSMNLGWISGLQAPSLIANWLNFPTGIGEIFYSLVHLIVNVPTSPFVTVARLIGWIGLIALIIRQWWLARNGGTHAVYRMAVALLALAIIAPPTLPWYLTWGFVIGSAFKWQRKHLAVVVAVSVFLVLVYYPTGEQGLYDWWFIAIVIAASLYAAASLLRPDPLGLIAAWRKPEAEFLNQRPEPRAATPAVAAPAEPAGP